MLTTSLVLSVDLLSRIILDEYDRGFPNELNIQNEWGFTVYLMLKAHHAFKTLEHRQKYETPLKILEMGDPLCDWIVAGKQWIQRRYMRYENRLQS